MTLLAWHYTIQTKLDSILTSGYLDPKKTVTPAHEQNILWFSKNQHYENTAQKAVMHNGAITSLGMQGTMEIGKGLIRFGYPISKLTEYKKLSRQAGIHPVDLKELEEIGIKQGAQPSDWMGSLKRIKVSLCFIQTYKDGEWVDLEVPNHTTKHL